MMRLFTMQHDFINKVNHTLTMRDLTRSEKWDKAEKFPIHYNEFIGTEKVILSLLTLLNRIPTDDVLSIESHYKHPYHHFVLTRQADMKIIIYMDGKVLDPTEYESIR